MRFFRPSCSTITQRMNGSNWRPPKKYPDPDCAIVVDCCPATENNSHKLTRSLSQSEQWLETGMWWLVALCLGGSIHEVITGDGVRERWARTLPEKQPKSKKLLWTVLITTRQSIEWLLSRVVAPSFSIERPYYHIRRPCNPRTTTVRTVSWGSHAKIFIQTRDEILCTLVVAVLRVALSWATSRSNNWQRRLGSGLFQFGCLFL